MNKKAGMMGCCIAVIIFVIIWFIFGQQIMSFLNGLFQQAMYGDIPGLTESPKVPGTPDEGLFRV